MHGWIPVYIHDDFAFRRVEYNHKIVIGWLCCLLRVLLTIAAFLCHIIRGVLRHVVECLLFSMHFLDTCTIMRGSVR